MIKLVFTGRGSPLAIYSVSLKNRAAYLLATYLLAGENAYLLEVLLKGGMKHV